MTAPPKHPGLTVLHLATINKPISPAIGYGPIETVIGNIDQGLDSLGHRSIVACSADSVVAGEKFATVPRSLGDYWQHDSPHGKELIDHHLSKALERAGKGDIDVIHMHEWLEAVYDGRFHPPVPIVMTLHVPAHLSGIKDLRRTHRAAAAQRPVHFVSISDFQRRQYSDFLNIDRTVFHGIDVSDYPCKEKPQTSGYLFTIGRITRVKGQDKAIHVARKTGAKLIIAGCVQDKPEDRAFFEKLKASTDLVADVSRWPVNRNYYANIMKPILDSDKQIIFIGELSSEAKKQWYRHARATIFPILWGEPFGMVLIESMACGTPILAFRGGAVPEIVQEGRTGFVVDTLESMIRAEKLLDRLDPLACRRHVETHFSQKSMAEGYAELYHRIVEAPEVAPTLPEARTRLSGRRHLHSA